MLCSMAHAASSLGYKLYEEQELVIRSFLVAEMYLDCCPQSLLAMPVFLLAYNKIRNYQTLPLL